MKKIIESIYEGVARHHESELPRGYLGMSMIGKPCELAAWHSWRQTTPRHTDGRIYMLFKTGHYVEAIVCEALRMTGYILQNAYPDRQLSFSDHNGYFAGHPDGIIEDTDQNMILEIKSSNSNKFKMFKMQGVEAVYPAYFAQMHLYMHYSGLRRAFFIVMNKEDSQLYVEMVNFKEEISKANIEKAKRILITHKPEGSVNLPKADTNECEFCPYKWICYAPRQSSELMPYDISLQSAVTCRSCSYFKMSDDLMPFCNHSAHVAPLKRLDRACKQWCWVLNTPFTIN